MALPIVPVMFRKHFDRDSRTWEITAFFVTIPADPQNYTMTCFAHVGEHGGASIDYFSRGKSCRPEEYAELLAEVKQRWEPDEDYPCTIKVYGRWNRRLRNEFYNNCRKGK